MAIVAVPRPRQPGPPIAATGPPPAPASNTGCMRAIRYTPFRDHRCRVDRALDGSGASIASGIPVGASVIYLRLRGLANARRTSKQMHAATSPARRRCGPKAAVSPPRTRVVVDAARVVLPEAGRRPAPSPVADQFITNALMPA